MSTKIRFSLVPLAVLAFASGCGATDSGDGSDVASPNVAGSSNGSTEVVAAAEGEEAGPLVDEAPAGSVPPNASAEQEPTNIAPETDSPAAMDEANALLPTCFKWNGQVDIDRALNRHACVAVAPGTYALTSPIHIPSGKTLIGESPNRTAATFYAAPGFTASALVAGPNEGPNGVVRRLSFDSKVRTQGIGARYLTISNVDQKNARCWGIAVAGPSLRVENSNIHHNGSDPTCNAAPGGGIYVTNNGPNPDNWAPVIIGNSIHDNVGPGIDIAMTWGGKIVNNDIRNNSHWAAVSVFGSNWEIYNNRIFHTSRNRPGIPDGQPYWSACRGGPNGVHPAAVMVCQRTDENGTRSTGNYIHDNSIASYYGVLLVGNDESRPYIAPRHNRVINNNFTGSVNACADDFRPGQWGNDKNTWSGGCTPQYF